MNNTATTKLLLVFIIILITLISSKAQSQQRVQHVSVDNNDWQTAFCWNTGAVPANNQTDNSDDIIIDSHVILNDALDVRSGTYLEVTNYDTLEVYGNVRFRNGSTILIEEHGVMIIHGNVENNNNSDDITVNGKIIINGNYSGGNGSALDGDGEMDVSGDVETSGTGNVFGSTEDCDSSEQDCSSSATSPLPIELISFNVQVKNDAVHLTWSTATEINNDYFTIERSRDAINFEAIEKIPGAGNSMTTINYETYDRNPYSGTSYYRLKQTDFDDSYSYSDIKTVNYSEHAMEVNLYPNPIQRGELLLLEFEAAQEFTISITDLSGRVVYNNHFNANNRLSIPIDFKPGSYILLATYNNKRVSKKVIIQ